MKRSDDAFNGNKEYSVWPQGLMVTYFPADQEVSDSIPGSAVGCFLRVILIHGVHGLKFRVSFLHILSCAIFGGQARPTNCIRGLQKLPAIQDIVL